MKQLIILLLVFTCFSLHAQSINGEFELTNLNSSEGRLSTYFDENSRLFFSDSILSVSNAARVYEFSFQLKNDSLLLSNSKNNFAFFVNYRNHELSLKNDYSSLSLSKIKQEPITSNLQEAAQEKEMIPNQNFTLEGFYRGVIGIFSILLLSFLFSANKRAINWKTVGVGLAAQLILAIGVLKVPFVQAIFEFVGKIFVKILDFTAEGSEFLLGDLMNVDSYGFIFLFQILPTIIFFSALTSLLFYLGVIQVVVKGMAWILTKLMNISGAEGLSVAGNIFLGQTESPLMIKAYLEKMTKSEILLVMIGGMATVAGGVLAAYIGFLGDGDPAKRLEFARHLLAASVMAAPGAIVVSKILYPQQEKIQRTAEVSQEKIGSNILDAISNGTSEGLRLAANVGAMLLVFIAFIALINYSLESFGNLVGLNSIIAQNSPYNSFSLESILGFIFAPVMWLIGVPKEDVMLMGQLLGIKLAASEFVGYIQLAELKNPANLLSLNYQKSVIMATYMLCGFANFASIGIQIGGIGSLAPGKRKLLSEFGMKALIGGTFASLLSATIAGMIIG